MSTLRVTAGTLRGRRILVPPRDVRPTSERARQAFFNIIGQRIDGAHFLDLFAGSGIFSFDGVRLAAGSDLRLSSLVSSGARPSLVGSRTSPSGGRPSGGQTFT